jgi:hypothetical protein
MAAIELRNASRPKRKKKTKKDGRILGPEVMIGRVFYQNVSCRSFHGGRSCKLGTLPGSSPLAPLPPD